MDGYGKLFTDINDAAVKRSGKLAAKKFLIDNPIGILALIVAVIALFK